MIDHKLENRREILTDFIDELRSYFNLTEYKDIVDYAKEKYRGYKDRLDYIKRRDAPINLIEKAEESTEEYKFILHLLASDKNFVLRH